MRKKRLLRVVALLELIARCSENRAESAPRQPRLPGRPTARNTASSRG